MPRCTSYTYSPTKEAKAAKARASRLRVHFKNTYETARTIKGKTLGDAKRYLHDVLHFRRIVPFRKFTGGPGKHAQNKEHKKHYAGGKWPLKSAKHLLNLLRNVEANAQMKNLDLNRCVIKHIQVNRASNLRRRTYRAHGRINPYLCSPCHVEIIVEEKQETVQKPSKKADKAPAEEEMALD
mmetsp:Transcript_28279/g.31415  ORF Transcript_28279/g.31415 Transcript_28279/m.31415 type:complete len:182 (+) Transcript_28279:26-571(+)